MQASQAYNSQLGQDTKQQGPARARVDDAGLGSLTLRLRATLRTSHNIATSYTRPHTACPTSTGAPP